MVIRKAGIALAVQALGYGLKDRGTGVAFLAGQEIFIFHGSQAGSGAYLASYPIIK
jgi:hypothetical protein